MHPASKRRPELERPGTVTSGNREHEGPLAFLDRERILLLVLGLVLFLPGLGRHDLWNPDEPRCAEVAREMLETSNFLVPQLNGEPYTHEPPLHFWAIGSISALLGGIDETAVRLPSALAAIATSVLVYAIALRLFSRRVAWLAALIFMSSYKVLWQGRTGQVGMVLTLWTTLAFYSWIRGTLEDRPGFYLAFFAVLGLATLTRGWEGSIPPLLAVVVFMSISGRLRDLRPHLLGPGILLLFAITLGWLVPAAAAIGRADFWTLLATEPMQRLSAIGSRTPLQVASKPWYYYFGTVPMDFLPWSFLFPTAAWISWNRARGEARTWMLLLSSWIVVTITLFSLSPMKRSVNVLTLFPALALVVGFGLDRAQEAWPRFRTATAVPALLASLLIAAAGVSVPLLQSRPELADLDPGLARAIAMILVLGAFAILLASRWFWAGNVRAAVDVIAVGMGLLILGASLIVAPRLDSFKSARPLASQVLAHLEPDQRLGMFPRLEPGVLFYTRHLVALAESEEELLKLLDEDADLLLVARRRGLADLDQPVPLAEIYRDHAFRDGWSLLGPARTESPESVPEGPGGDLTGQEPDG
jgi:4-amino-4-deoxy-L-arabinose transferase-like glycosyltransferase